MMSQPSPEDLEEKKFDVPHRFKDFLEKYTSREGVAKYEERIAQMVHMGQRSLIVDFDDLIYFDRELAQMVVLNPKETLQQMNATLREYVEMRFPEIAAHLKRLYVRLRNIPPIYTYRIRDISTDLIGRLISVEGIVTRVTKVDAKLVRAKYSHYDPETGNVHTFDFPDEGEMSDRLERPQVCPHCMRPGRFDLVVEESEFIDWQKLVIQEKPEEIPGGQIPRSIEIVLTGDIVDIARPGDRVMITGILKVTPLSFIEARGSRTIFNFYIDANYVEIQHKVLEEIEITKEDEEKIRELSRDPWVRERIIASIAPGIYGHWDIKEAIALLMFGGNPKVLEDGTKIRGDTHVLLVGDPGTAKSQLLQFAARIAPRGLYTSGKGSTAAGLTATVLRDKVSGEYYLEAGALVLADGGVACIDEIDKMRDEDRSAIHEALEQQSVSIAKAGIVARLNARASVLAAGNPKYGRYDITQPLSKNLDLPPTIISRFDLLFIIQDFPNKEHDSRLARHILEVHTERDKARPLVDIELLKKYISYARRYIRPELTPEAKKLIEEFYVSMRQASITETGEVAAIAITPRQLEALIRLAEAHAKMALKPKATVEDVEEAIRLMMATLSRVGFDIESKRIDIDLIETGTSATVRYKKKIARDFVTQLLSEVGEIEVSELIRRALERGLDKDLVQEELRAMKKEGIIYEPRIGKIALVK